MRSGNMKSFSEFVLGVAFLCSFGTVNSLQGKLLVKFVGIVQCAIIEQGNTKLVCTVKCYYFKEGWCHLIVKILINKYFLS